MKVDHMEIQDKNRSQHLRRWQLFTPNRDGICSSVYNPRDPRKYDTSMLFWYQHRMNVSYEPIVWHTFGRDNSDYRISTFHCRRATSNSSNCLLSREQLLLFVFCVAVLTFAFQLAVDYNACIALIQTANTPRPAHGMNPPQSKIAWPYSGILSNDVDMSWWLVEEVKDSDGATV